MRCERGGQLSGEDETRRDRPDHSRSGCCCGNTERGLPDVPVEQLKSEWRKRGLLKRIQLTISGCVGPCDVPNVVVITTAGGTQWLGNVSTGLT